MKRNGSIIKKCRCTYNRLSVFLICIYLFKLKESYQENIPIILLICYGFQITKLDLDAPFILFSPAPSTSMQYSFKAVLFKCSKVFNYCRSHYSHGTRHTYIFTLIQGMPTSQTSRWWPNIWIRQSSAGIVVSTTWPTHTCWRIGVPVDSKGRRARLICVLR